MTKSEAHRKPNSPSLGRLILTKRETHEASFFWNKDTERSYSRNNPLAVANSVFLEFCSF